MLFFEIVSIAMCIIFLLAVATIIVVHTIGAICDFVKRDFLSGIMNLAFSIMLATFFLLSFFDSILV
jgi:hypothetical protein